MKSFLIIIFCSFFIYLFSWFIVYSTDINKLVIQSEDTIPALFLPVTIIKEKTFYADTYYPMIIKRYPHPDDKSYAKGLVPFYFRKIITTQNGKVAEHYISAFPIITGLLALPVYVIPVLTGMTITFENLTILGHIASSLIVAVSGVFLYLVLWRYLLRDDKSAKLLTVIYLFATINFSLISQALWQHGAIQFFTILCLYFLYKSLDSSKAHKLLNIFLSTFFLSFAVLSRPTAAIFIPFISLIFIGKHLNTFQTSIKASAIRLSVFLFGFIPAIIFFIWYNNQFYLSIANQGYSNQLFSEWLSKFPESFLALWISPSKGILVYSPIFIFALIGFILSLRNKISKENFEYAIYGCLVLLHTLIMSKWKHWYGGWSFGYRMASDVIPFLVLLLIPYIKSTLYEKTKTLFKIALVFSILVQVYGIIFFDGIWHSAYDRGFEDTSWLWSLRDSEMAFNIRRVLVKFNLLDKACPQCLPNN